MTSSFAPLRTLLLLAAAGPAAASEPVSLEAVPLEAVPQEGVPAQAVSVQAVHADVRVLDGGRWRPLAPGQMLPADAELRSGPRAGAALALPSGGTLAVGEGTALRLSSGEKPRVHLARGGVEAVLVAGAALSLAPAGGGAPVGLQGEGVRVRLLQAGEAGLEVAALEGAVRLSLPEGEHVVEPGERVRVQGGRAGVPEPLLAAPRALAPAADARFLCPGLVVRLAWEAVPEAAGYLVQVAQGGGFGAPVLRAHAERPAFLFAAPALTPSPDYRWRVAAVGADGGLGGWSTPRPLHCEPEAPREHLHVPAVGARLAVAPEGEPFRTDFRWEPLAGAGGYRLVLSPTADLHAPGARVEEVSGDLTELSLEGLLPGTYYWGVYAGGEPLRPLFLSPRRLDVVPRVRVKVPSVLSDWGD